MIAFILFLIWIIILLMFIFWTTIKFAIIFFIFIIIWSLIPILTWYYSFILDKKKQYNKEYKKLLNQWYFDLKDNWEWWKYQEFLNDCFNDKIEEEKMNYFFEQEDKRLNKENDNTEEKINKFINDNY